MQSYNWNIVWRNYSLWKLTVFCTCSCFAKLNGVNTTQSVTVRNVHVTLFRVLTCIILQVLSSTVYVELLIVLATRPTSVAMYRFQPHFSNYLPNFCCPHYNKCAVWCTEFSSSNTNEALESFGNMLKKLDVWQVMRANNLLYFVRPCRLLEPSVKYDVLWTFLVFLGIQ